MDQASLMFSCVSKLAVAPMSLKEKQNDLNVHQNWIRPLRPLQRSDVVGHRAWIDTSEVAKTLSQCIQMCESSSFQQKKQLSTSGAYHKTL